VTAANARPRYALALAAGAILLAMSTIAPADYLIVHCDAISIGQVGALAIGGFGLAALTALPRLHSIASRGGRGGPAWSRCLPLSSN